MCVVAIAPNENAIAVDDEDALDLDDAEDEMQVPAGGNRTSSKRKVILEDDDDFDSDD